MENITKNQSGQGLYIGLSQDRTARLTTQEVLLLPGATNAVETSEILIVQEWMESLHALRVDPRAEEGALANSKMHLPAFRRIGWLDVPLRVVLTMLESVGAHALADNAFAVLKCSRVFEPEPEPVSVQRKKLYSYWNASSPQSLLAQLGARTKILLLTAALGACQISSLFFIFRFPGDRIFRQMEDAGPHTIKEFFFSGLVVPLAAQPSAWSVVSASLRDPQRW